MAELGARLRSGLVREGGVVLVVLIGVIVLFSILSPFFFTVDNVKNVLVQSVFVLLVAVGVTFVLLTGGIDLSVGSTMGLSAGLSVLTLSHGAPVTVAVLVGLVAGAAIGLVNGLLVTRVGISDFIATLAMLGIVRGVLQLITAKEPLRVHSSAYTKLTSASVAGIPLPVIIAAAIVVLASFVLWRTRFGRWVFAVGMSRDAAHIAGVDVPGVRLRVFVLAGALAAVAGMLLASRLSSVQPELGTGYELQAIAAAVIGGTSLSGGRGRLSGTVVGALLLAIIENGLRLLEVNAFYFTIITGLIIVAAVALEHGLQHGLAGLRGRRPARGGVAS